MPVVPISPRRRAARPRVAVLPTPPQAPMNQMPMRRLLMVVASSGEIGDNRVRQGKRGAGAKGPRPLGLIVYAGRGLGWTIVCGAGGAGRGRAFARALLRQLCSSFTQFS